MISKETSMRMCRRISIWRTREKRMPRRRLLPGQAWG
jgi:hypothetical protein